MVPERSDAEPWKWGESRTVVSKVIAVEPVEERSNAP